MPGREEAKDSLRMDSLEAPDRFVPLLGIRQFLLDYLGQIWSPNQEGVLWNAGWMKARCSPNSHNGVQIKEPHDSPHEGCRCGIYGAYSLDGLFAHTTPNWNEWRIAYDSYTRTPDIAKPGEFKMVTYGLVALAGNVIKYQYVMRAQYARIVGLANGPLNHGCSNTRPHFDTLKSVAQVNGVDCVDMGELTTTDDMRKLAKNYNCAYWCPGDARKGV